MNATEEMIDDAAPPQDASPGDLEKIQKMHTRRLDEYLRDESTNPDPLQTAAAVHTALNLEMAYRLGRGLMSAADETGSLADVVADDPRTLSAMLQLQRQADRFINLGAARERTRGSTDK
jgi:hypothetical protein